MATQTLLKNDGTFVYEDYLNGRAALRIRELNSANPSQGIKRTSNDSTNEAVLVSKDWYDARVAAYAAVGAATFTNIKELVDDDFMGKNLQLMTDLIQGRYQTNERTKKVVAEGITQNDFKVFTITDLKEFYPDNSTVIPFEQSVKVGGDVLALLLHTAHYAALGAAPVTTTYAGTGDGTLEIQLHHGGAITETITITATSATMFSVAGSTSGAIGTATVGTVFESPQLRLLITDGGSSFVGCDVFTVASVAAT